MVFEFNKNQTVFVPREGGIFSPQAGGENSGSKEESKKPLPIIDASRVPTATWIVPGRVEDTLNKEKK